MALQRKTGLSGGLGMAVSALAVIVLMLCTSLAPAQTLPAPNGTQPLDVGVSIKVDQVTFLDQKSENFGIVAELRFQWQDDHFTFDPMEVGRDYKLMMAEDFLQLALDRHVVAPMFVFQNQQDQRWQQEAIIKNHSDGRLEFYERSTLTLQAPYFDFRRYPFDTQVFTVKLVSLYPLDAVVFTPMNEFSGLGDKLGEEAWILSNPKLLVSSEVGASGLESSSISLVFDGQRHQQYYFLRIFLPMSILILVSWVTFFLDNYSRRIDLAGTNLLVFVAFNFAISDSLPQLGYVTFMDFVLQLMFVVTGAIVVVNVLLRRLQKRGHEETARVIDTYVVKWIFPIGYVGVIALAVLRFFATGN